MVFSIISLSFGGDHDGLDLSCQARQERLHRGRCDTASIMGETLHHFGVIGQAIFSYGPDDGSEPG